MTEEKTLEFQIKQSLLGHKGEYWGEEFFDCKGSFLHKIEKFPPNEENLSRIEAESIKALEWMGPCTVKATYKENSLVLSVEVSKQLIKVNIATNT